MQTRNPLIISPVEDDSPIWEVNGDGQAQLVDLPLREVTPGGAFIANGTGGITIAVGQSITEDEVWRENGTGGIELNL